ncbi:MAG: hypothetical protein FWE63_04590 [Bacteroidales bacterium]|nr:hypothetical protein [Bacteroidales bacterium]
MKINHDNYESYLVDYLDGTLSDIERAEVGLFLQQNPEIADQISDFEDVILSSNSEITYDRKEELITITLPNQEFEQWEHTHPKLPKTLVSYPYKHKLLKPEIRRMPQWTWYAAAACLAIVVLVVRPMFETKNPEWSPIAVLPIVEEIEGEELRIEDEKIENQYKVASTGSTTKVLPEILEGNVIKTTSHPTTPNLASDSEQDNNVQIREYLAITTIQPIHNFQILQETTIIESRQILHFTEDDNFIQEDNTEISRRERWNLAVNTRILDPLRTGIHNVVKRFHERKTDVELYLEEREIPRFFAQN